MLDGSISIEVLKEINKQDSSWRQFHYDAFVEVVASNLSDRALYNLTHKLVEVEVQGSIDGSLRNSSLAKAFLKYELLKGLTENSTCGVPATFLSHMEMARNKDEALNVSFFVNTLLSTEEDQIRMGNEISILLAKGEAVDQEELQKKCLGDRYKEINAEMLQEIYPSSLSDSIPSQGIEKIVNFYRDININEITNSVPEEILTFFANIIKDSKKFSKIDLIIKDMKITSGKISSLFIPSAEINTNPGFRLDSDISSSSTGSSVTLSKRVDSTIEELKNTLDQMKENRHRR